MNKGDLYTIIFIIVCFIAFVFIIYKVNQNYIECIGVCESKNLEFKDVNQGRCECYFEEPDGSLITKTYKRVSTNVSSWNN